MRRMGWVVAVLMLATPVWAGQRKAQQPDESGVYLPGDGVKSPEFLVAADAVYPADASRPDASVIRTLSVVIGSDGVPLQIKVWGDASDRFNQAAISAIRRSTFAAGSLHGKPVPVRVLVSVPIEPGKKPHHPELVPVRDNGRPTLLYAPEPKVDRGAGYSGKYTGTAVISVVVNDLGLPTRLRGVRSINPTLDEDALEAVAQYRFRPAMVDGSPISAQIMIRVVFHKAR